MSSAPPTARTLPPEQRGAGREPTARALVLVISVSALLFLGAAAVLLPVPYVVFSPGPVRDTLGAGEDGEPLITVDGAETYPTTGQLDLTTIRVAGGPLGDVSIVDAIRAYVDPARALRPVESVYPPDETREEAREASTAQMAQAQQSAAVAALVALGEEVPARLSVTGFGGNPASEAVLREGDVLTAVDGTTVQGSGQLVDLLQTYSAGDVVDVTVLRDGAEVTEPVELAAGDEGAVILGVLLSPEYELPYEVTYDVDGIGGPSAGLMFALGIYDKLSPGPLTGGTHVAGTGTVSDDGTVGSIDGIQQKMVGAEGVGAEWFLAPAGNCDAVVGAVPDGIEVAAVATLAEAVEVLEAVAAGETDDVPSCEDVLADT